MTDGEVGYHGGALVVPTGWRLERDVDPYALLVLPGVPGDTFVANLNVVREVADGSTASVADHLASLATSLDDHHLVDLEELPVAGGPSGVRLLSLHSTGGEGLVTEQWVTAGAPRSVLSATCLATEYDTYAEVFAEVAASWRADDAAAR